MSNENDSFFQEVEESVRADRYTAWANKYGIYVIGAVVLILAAVGGWRLYEGYERQQSEARSEQLAAAQEQISKGDDKGAADAFERLSKSGPATFRSLAMMERAQALQQLGDMEGALAQFDAAAETASDDTMKNTARLRAAYLVAESQDLQAVRARVQPLIDKGGPFSYPARELLGVKAWETGDYALARETLEALNLAFEAPESVRQRASLVLSLMGPAAPDAAGAAPAAPAPAQASGEPK